MEKRGAELEVEAVDLTDLEELTPLLPEGHIEIDATGGLMSACC